MSGRDKAEKTCQIQISNEMMTYLIKNIKQLIVIFEKIRVLPHITPKINSEWIKDLSIKVLKSHIIWNIYFSSYIYMLIDLAEHT